MARNSQPPEDPELEQQPTSGAAETDSSEGSSASSASELLADPGPEFDPGQAGQDATERDSDRLLSASPGGQTGLEVEWAPDAVRSLLETQGAALHAIAGKAEQDWVYTKTELDAISKPLTRILNRYDATRIAAGTGDEIALLLGLTGHTLRSLQERKAALAEEDDEPPAAAVAYAGPQPPGPQPPIQEMPIQ